MGILNPFFVNTLFTLHVYIYKNIVFPALAEYSQIIRMCESQLHHVNFDPKYPKILTLTCFA